MLKKDNYFQLGKTYNFTGIFERYGNSDEGFNSTILLLNVKSGKNLFDDHVWFKKSHFQNTENLNKGDIVNFKGEVVECTKGYRGQNFIDALENPIRKELTILCDLNENFIREAQSNASLDKAFGAYNYKPSKKDFYRYSSEKLTLYFENYKTYKHKTYEIDIFKCSKKNNRKTENTIFKVNISKIGKEWYLKSVFCYPYNKEFRIDIFDIEELKTCFKLKWFLKEN